ncbi:hypothetical protein BJF83_00590 [Nocardiopsis sp. CNR-923]|uniref:hypothetical protein n=1 Tax=Nocardiopsis sp. CNR-923 TaxID=1904965 RepID=UPI000960D35F|nr:hypothetical protein [Nocardiopsis sp. CNR-923]OLT29146.1 hypothetical protein BJF83_00590 [Nocardiopsis sp. CNR-923]
MSRAESGHRRRSRRGGRRREEDTNVEEHAEDRGQDVVREDDYDPDEDFSAEYGHTHTRAEAEAEHDEHDEHDDTAPAGDDTGGRRSRGSRRKRDGDDRGDPNRRGGVDRVSAFSAAAIKRVSVLGERPNQIVYTLAEQSKRKRGTAVLGGLMGAFGVALVALLGLLLYQLFSPGGGALAQGENSIVAPPEGHGTLTPEQFLLGANLKDTFGPIDERPEGAEPMTEDLVFGDAEDPEVNGMELTLSEGRVTDSCTSLVWGEDLGQSLIDANCSGAATGVYTDPDEEYVAQVVLFDLADAEGATRVARALDPNDTQTGAGFLLADTGEVPGLNEGYSQASTQVMGHYLAVSWVARTDGSPPGDDTDMASVSVAAMGTVLLPYEEVVARTQAEE